MVSCVLFSFVAKYFTHGAMLRYDPRVNIVFQIQK